MQSTKGTIRQLTWTEAAELSAKAAQAARPMIGRDEETIPAGATYADLVRMMERAAFNALQLAGNLRENNARDHARTVSLANRAERTHREWCRQTGKRF